jgi:uncharacterized membrane protein (DUF485 family)
MSFRNHSDIAGIALERDQKEWDRIADTREFKDLIGLKKTFIIPAFIVFLIHFFALAVLVGYAPRLASTRVIGTVNVAYLFALSQFVVGWVIAGLYLLVATRFDALTKDILAQIEKNSGDR